MEGMHLLLYVLDTYLLCKSMCGEGGYLFANHIYNYFYYY